MPNIIRFLAVLIAVVAMSPDNYRVFEVLILAVAIIRT